MAKKKESNQPAEKLKVDASQFQEDDVNSAVDSHAKEDDKRDAELGALRKRVQDAEVELQDKHNQVLYHMAESQNIRDRASRDVENAHRYGTENLLKKLLPVLDGLERGMAESESDDARVKALYEGMVLTHKMFLEVLEGFHVVQVDPKGEAFNAELHEAISMKEDKEAKEKTVIEVVQKGYMLNGRLVRPALVIVAK